MFRILQFNIAFASDPGRDGINIVNGIHLSDHFPVEAGFDF